MGERISVKTKRIILWVMVVAVGLIVIWNFLEGYIYNIQKSKNFDKNPKYIIAETVADEKGNHLSLIGSHKLIEFNYDYGDPEYDAKYVVDNICYNSVISQMRKLGAVENKIDSPIDSNASPSCLRSQPELWFDSDGNTEADYIFIMSAKSFEFESTSGQYNYIAVVLYEESGKKILHVIKSID